MCIVSSRLTLTHLIFMASLAAAEDSPGSLILVPDTCCCGAHMASRLLLLLHAEFSRMGQLEDNEPSFDFIIHPRSNINVCHSDVPDRISRSLYSGGCFVVRFRVVFCCLCGCFALFSLTSNCLTCAWLFPPPPHQLKTPSPCLHCLLALLLHFFGELLLCTSSVFYCKIQFGFFLFSLWE